MLHLEALAPWSWFLSLRCDEAPMRHNPKDFVIEQVLESLERAAAKFPAGSDENASIELAAYALTFIEWEDHLDAFRPFLERAKRPASQTIFIEHVFADMPEAQRWLNAQPSPAKGTLVKVAGKTHTVWKRGGDLLLLPSFTPQELGEPGDEDEGVPSD